MKEHTEILYKCCDSQEELIGILQLQRINHLNAISKDEGKTQGFLTCLHTFKILAKWNALAPHIIAVKDGGIIGYVLAMTSEAMLDMPILKPMFYTFNKLEYEENVISTYNYLVVGQVCVAKEFRGTKVLQKLYQLYKNIYSEKFDFAITEISTKNIRSMKAHKKNGFEELLNYNVQDGEEWCIVILDWNKKNRVV